MRKYANIKKYAYVITLQFLNLPQSEEDESDSMSESEKVSHI